MDEIELSVSKWLHSYWFSGDHTQAIEFEEIKLVILYDFQSFQNVYNLKIF